MQHRVLNGKILLSLFLILSGKHTHAYHETFYTNTVTCFVNSTPMQYILSMIFTAIKIDNFQLKLCYMVVVRQQLRSHGDRTSVSGLIRKNVTITPRRLLTQATL